jgi:enoyl-[acyl-carrier-protein] reductase (NADH)
MGPAIAALHALRFSRPGTSAVRAASGFSIVAISKVINRVQHGWSVARRRSRETVQEYGDVAFLVSTQASYITGAVIRAEGGLIPLRLRISS